MEETSLLGSTGLPVYHSQKSSEINELEGSQGRSTNEVAVYQSAEQGEVGRSTAEAPVYHSLTPAQAVVAEQMLAFGRGKVPQALATLSGYAGVGKTTVVAHVVSELAAEGVNIVVLAPTHKALAVLSEKLGDARIETMTVQSALALKVSERPDGTQTLMDEGKEGSLREFDLAVIDEASMVSEGMFATALLKRRRCRLLFVGDPAQLPPVDKSVTDTPRQPGEEVLSPAFGPLVPLHWRLTEVVRQAQGNPIIRLATAARSCIEAGAEFGLQVMSEQLQAGDDDYLAMQPGGVAEVSRLVADAIQHGQDTRALAWDNATVLAINANVHAMVYPGQGDYPSGTQLMAQDGFTGIEPGSENSSKRVNVPVRNSALLTVRGCEVSEHPDEPQRPAYRLDLEADSGERLRCWVAMDQKQWQADISECFAEYRRLKLREQMTYGAEREALRKQAGAASAAGWALRARYAPLRYAYAMTVHKSQGSTFDAVVLAWESFQRCRDVQQRNRLAYVALTRTRRFAVVCA